MGEQLVTEVRAALAQHGVHVEALAQLLAPAREVDRPAAAGANVVDLCARVGQARRRGGQDRNAG